MGDSGDDSAIHLVRGPVKNLWPETGFLFRKTKLMMKGLFMKNLPPLRALQAFEVFGRLGSVTATADALGVSVGAISQQLRKAEAAAGIALVERAGRNVVLTARGRAYHGQISAAFDQLRSAQDWIERLNMDVVLSLSCLPSLASKWLGSRLLDWQDGHPSAVVRLIGEDAEPQLGRDQVDFRLSYGRKVAQFDHRAELFTDCVVPACSPDFLKRHPVRSVHDILDCPLLGIEWSHDQGKAPDWVSWAKSIGVDRTPPGGLVRFSLSSAAIDAAINGRGFVLAQLSMAGDDIMSGRLVVPFDAPLRLAEAYFVAWDRAALEKPLGAELRTWLFGLGKQQELISKRLRSVNPWPLMAP
jgi:LysR family transcriptional regulator, glycine cleavage system transcriptional activator